MSITRLEEERPEELAERKQHIEFGGRFSPARDDMSEFREELKYLLKWCLSPDGEINPTPDLKMTLPRGSRLTVVFTNKLVVEQAFFGLKPHLRRVLLERFVYRKPMKQIEHEAHYRRDTLQKHLRQALDSMYYTICRD